MNVEVEIGICPRFGSIKAIQEGRVQTIGTIPTTSDSDRAILVNGIFAIAIGFDIEDHAAISTSCCPVDVCHGNIISSGGCLGGSSQECTKI